MSSLASISGLCRGFGLDTGVTKGSALFTCFDICTCGWSHGMNCSVLSPSTECYAFPRPTFVLKDTFIQSLKFLHLDGFVDGRYVDAVRWTLGDNQRSSSKLVVCRAIFWRFKQGTESPTKVSQGRQSDCHAISLSKNATIRGPTLRPRSGSPDFFVPFAPCGVPFDRTIRVARGFAFAFAFGFACPSQTLRSCR